MSNKTCIVIITDAWYPQVNGVVTTYDNIIENLPERYETSIVSPERFRSMKNPFYKEVSLSFCTYGMMKKIVISEWLKHQGIWFHIATEGILGFQAKRVLTDMGISYTTAYHTKFPEFIKAMFGIPVSWTSWYFDWFHKSSKIVMMSSKSVADRFPTWNCKVLGKGYDEHFKFVDRDRNQVPVLLYVGRVSKEKNIEEFCKLDFRHDVRKIVVGDGPIKKQLQKKYPDVEFAGYKFGEELAKYYQLADVMVFPSKADTYGIVVLESMACGTPVAAFPVDGAVDQISNGVNGFADHNLLRAVQECFNVDRHSTAGTVKNITWKNSARDFIKFIEE
jgi:glycosyltransferase involved in cell wall biosynthesis